jgi:GTP pyrophosphokinase
MARFEATAATGWRGEVADPNMANVDKSASLPGFLDISRSALADRSLHGRFGELLDLVRQNRPNDDVDVLRRAFEFAAEQHQSQVRESGEPYLSHPLEVAHILADLRLDVTTLAAALLHDVVEDTRIPLSDIASRFGSETARLVEGVTKISRLGLVSPEARQAESVRKMLLAMVTDVRVVMVKLADRLHNMRTRNTRYLRADRSQAWNGRNAGRSGRSRLQLPRTGRLSRTARYRGRSPR